MQTFRYPLVTSPQKRTHNCPVETLTRCAVLPYVPTSWPFIHATEIQITHTWSLAHDFSSLSQILFEYSIFPIVSLPSHFPRNRIASVRAWFHSSFCSSLQWMSPNWAQYNTHSSQLLLMLWAVFFMGSNFRCFCSRLLFLDLFALYFSFLKKLTTWKLSNGYNLLRLFTEAFESSPQMWRPKIFLMFFLKREQVLN